jgi:hypothetical protein
MVVSQTRHQAIELARNFATTISLATGKPVDFYMLLWVAHWAIENYGLDKTRQALVDIMLDTNFNPDNVAIMLRDRLFTDQVEEDILGDWFKRAIIT